MLGSAEDAEDLVQETLLRAWRRRETFRGRASVRAWLYGIATNACLDELEKRGRRRLLPAAFTGPADPIGPVPAPATEVTWLEPYPDRLLDELVDPAEGPDESSVARETIELAFLVAIQQLPPRQRAVLILRDVLGWSAREVATALETTVIAANSALQRGRETLARHLPDKRAEWTRPHMTSSDEQSLLNRYMGAWDRSDVDDLAALLAEDARLAMPPTPAWYDGRDAIRDFLRSNPLAPSAPRHIHVPTRANRQPAFGIFVSGPDDNQPRPLGLSVLRLTHGLIAEIDIFLQPQLVERFAISPPR